MKTVHYQLPVNVVGELKDLNVLKKAKMSMLFFFKKKLTNRLLASIYKIHESDRINQRSIALVIFSKCVLFS